MSLILVLVLILVGIGIGGAGMRRLGQVARRLVGPWRPGVGVMAMVALVAAVALAARGAELAAGALVLISLVLAVVARRRPPKSAAPLHSGVMTRAEAAGILGVPLDATGEVVDVAYRRLMRRTHPDLGGTAGL